MMWKYFCKFEQCVLDEKTKHSQKSECFRSMAYILVREISPNKTFLAPSFVEVDKTLWAPNSINFFEFFCQFFGLLKRLKNKKSTFLTSTCHIIFDSVFQQCLMFLNQQPIKISWVLSKLFKIIYFQWNLNVKISMKYECQEIL